ncbi:MAG TPA: hypothetical protein VHV08_11330 [Pirellulales bacterium]|jgi:hypothetical protein|nr:hypothetical protein [Pirellulales bacterium]
MDSALIDQTSELFLGRWQRLVSTTNWEKGRIILEWRQAVCDSGAPNGDYADEAWSRRVAGVTPQHVGRLRRVYERFGEVRMDYEGLFWSHFQAALDWDDAEMWLEGAVQNQWSISEMRAKRHETLGTAAQPLGNSESEPWDEDAEPENASGDVVAAMLGTVQVSDDLDTQEDEDDDVDRSPFDDAGDEFDPASGKASEEPSRPFENLPPLPPDVGDAFEAYKLCILRHKLSGWQELSRETLLASLTALEQLALA